MALRALTVLARLATGRGGWHGDGGNPNMPLSLRLPYRRSTVPLPVIAATLALGALGAGIATLLHLPLPLLLGPLLVTAACAIAKVRVFGTAPALPGVFRSWSIPIIGVSIGGAFHPGLLQRAAEWWPSLVALGLIVPVAQAMGYLIYRRLGRFDPATSFFGAIPGGLITAIAMGEEAGGNIAMTTLLQFMRLILTITLVPLAFTILTGGAVGSAAGAVLGGAEHSAGALDLVVLMVLAAIGAVVGAALKLPASVITGPLLVSGAAHLTGVTEAVPPFWMIGLTQLFIGTSLGARFAGIGSADMGRAMGLALLNVLATLLLGLLVAVIFHGLVGEPVAAVFLALAPGGVAEMSLVAVSLHVSVVYVSAHHVARIVFAVMLARVFAARIAAATERHAREGAACEDGGSAVARS